jgi:hypothetical protein
MKFLKNIILPVLSATVWISISEFVRNQFLLKSLWTEHYASLGLTFPAKPVNGAMWGIWSLVFAISIFIISRKFDLLQTTILSWITGFLMMWVVLWNMSVFPVGILWLAIPLSLLEAFLASFIIHWLKKKTG